MKTTLQWLSVAFLVGVVSYVGLGCEACGCKKKCPPCTQEKKVCVPEKKRVCKTDYVCEDRVVCHTEKVRKPRTICHDEVRMKETTICEPLPVVSPTPCPPKPCP